MEPMTPRASEVTSNWIVAVVAVLVLALAWARSQPWWVAAMIDGIVVGALVGPLTPWSRFR